jgi:hypothetical protein
MIAMILRDFGGDGYSHDATTLLFLMLSGYLLPGKVRRVFVFLVAG